MLSTNNLLYNLSILGRLILQEEIIKNEKPRS